MRTIDILREMRMNYGVVSKLLVFGLRMAQKSTDVIFIGWLTRQLYRVVCLMARVDLPHSVQVGYGIRIFHPFCIAIHPDVKIGTNCVLRHGVTIGVRGEGEQDVPEIGNDVEFGCYAVVVGKVRVPDGAKLAALSIFRGS